MSVPIVERIVERGVERIAIVSSLRGITLMISMMLISAQLLAQPRRKEQGVEHPTFYRTVQVDGSSIFYREAGPKSAPTILLLHGLPSSSRMFEPLFKRLSDRYHLVAPDLPRVWSQRLARSKKVRLHIRSLCRDHESFQRSAGTLALHTLHAGLRRPGRFSHGLSPSRTDRGVDRSGCGRAQRRARRQLETAPRFLGRS